MQYQDINDSAIFGIFLNLSSIIQLTDMLLSKKAYVDVLKLLHLQLQRMFISEEVIQFYKFQDMKFPAGLSSPPLCVKAHKSPDQRVINDNMLG